MIDTLRVRQARKEKGFTQDYVASKLSMSRPSYIKFEDGAKDLTVSQAEQLETLLGIRLLEDPEKTQKHVNKLKFMMLAFIELAGADGDGRITKTKLAKLLYFADAKSYVDRGVSMSQLTYRRLPQGPVAYEYLQLVDDLADQHVIDIKFSGLAQMIGATEPTNIYDLGLDNYELEQIHNISSAWKNKRTDAIVNFSHEHPTWKKAEMYAPIDMSLLRSWDKAIY